MTSAKNIFCAAFAIAALFMTVADCASAAEMTKKDCLACHGPFEALHAKNVKVDADPAPVNPHVPIPHTGKGELDEIWECTMCHTPHTMPPKKDPAREPATVEACYSCHHEYNFKKCSECHGG